MELTPAYLTSVATFYDMLVTHPKPRNDVFVCTNISCSLRGADEFYEAMLAAAAEDPNVGVRSFECLGACDIAPMASVNGEYVGPLEVEDAGTIVEDLRAGRPVLPDKQLRRRPCVDEGTTTPPAVQGHRRARAQHARGLPAARRLRAPYARRCRCRARRCSTSCSPRTSAAVAAPASRWAARRRSCPTGTWSSTSSATRTSPSRGRSRTAS